MDSQIIAAIIFFLLIGIFLFVQRRKLEVQRILYPVIYFVLYRSKAGINWMNSISKNHPKLVRGLGYTGIGLGFAGMGFICYGLLSNIYQILFVPTAAPGVGLVLPFKVKGAFYVPFFYWIISIFVIAAVHEFSHGVVARAHGLKVKSSGLAFLGIVIPVLPAAFVEPDEKEIPKRPAKQQLSVFAAGPFSNIVLGFTFLAVLLFAGAPLLDSVLDFDGVNINGFIRDHNNMTLPAESAGITEGEIVQQIDGTPIEYLYNFSTILQNRTPGDMVYLVTDKGAYNITLTSNPENENQSYLGVYVQQHSQLNKEFIGKYGESTANFILWFTGTPGRHGLLFWLYLLNIGIGLFNLVPVGPLDGGRMLSVALKKYIKNGRGEKLFNFISMFFLILILVNILASFVK